MYLRSLPINDMPEVFGLHDNANITFAQNETYNLLNGLLLLQVCRFAQERAKMILISYAWQSGFNYNKIGRPCLEGPNREW